MLSILRKTTAPLISLFIFVVGSGLFMTLLALRLQVDHARPIIIGAMTAAYYVGLLLGSFRIERFIIRVGHIRAFAAFASSLAVMCTLHGIFVHAWLWIILRLMAGFATAGLFIVVESWLLIAGTIKTRGQVLALYMVTFYAAQAIGQFLINLANVKDLMLYAVAGMCASLAVIPLAVMRRRSPEFEEPSSLSLKKLYKASPTGVLGCLCGGLILAAIYGLLPVYLFQQTQSTHDVALFMALTIFGGMALQYPVGRLSDYTDRRTVLIVICAVMIIVAAFLMFMHDKRWLFAITTFIFGGLSFTVYPLCISHGCDVLDTKDIVAGTQGLLLAYSIGACFGPLLAPIFMHILPAKGLFVYFIIIGAFLVLFFAYRKLRRAPVPIAEQEQFVSLPQTSAVVAELDPRREGDH